MVSALSVTLLVIAAIMIVSTVIQFHRRKITVVWALFWSGLWIVGSVLTFFTGWLDHVADVLAIGDGKTLVIYIVIILLLLFNYRQFIQYQGLKAEISRLVEEIAKREAKRGKR